MTAPLHDRVYARKIELEDALANCSRYDAALRRAIETALATVYSLMTGDLAHPSEVVSRTLARWLERNRYLARDVPRS